MTAFVVIVGPDGVGKTAVARALTTLWGGPAAYFHFCPPFASTLPSGPPDTSIPPPTKGDPDGSRVLGWLRLARSWCRFWLGYLTSVRPALRRGSLVVADRWAYGYVVQPFALKYYGPRWLAVRMLRALPQPDLVVNLTAPSDVIRARKQELTLDQIRQELTDWLTLPEPALQTFEAVEPPDKIAGRIRAALQR